MLIFVSELKEVIRMNNLGDLQKRALEIASRYDQLNIKREGKTWERERFVKGFAKDVSDLLDIVNAPELDDAKLQHELADCLWSVLVIAHKYDVDMGQAFYKTMDELDERLDKELK